MRLLCVPMLRDSFGKATICAEESLICSSLAEIAVIDPGSLILTKLKINGWLAKCLNLVRISSE